VIGPLRASAIDPPLLLALAIVGGGALALQPLAACVGLVGVALALRRHASRLLLVTATLAFAASGLRASASLEDARSKHAELATRLSPPQRCLAEGVVVSSPVVLGGRGRADVDLRSGECGTRSFRAPLRARLYALPRDIARGDRVRVIADLAATHLFANAELSDRLVHVARTGVAASGGALDVEVLQPSDTLAGHIDHARGRVRDRIDATYHPDARAMARALVLGETDLPEEDVVAFRESGLAHLLAVSGAHLVIAVVALVLGLHALLVRVPPLSRRLDVGRISAAVGIPLSWLYADFAGGGGSATRAAAMLTMVLGARVLSRRPDPVRSFSGALFVGAALDPLVIGDVSFTLSAAATAGLFLGSRPLTERLLAWLPSQLTSSVVARPVRRLVQAAAATITASAACAPALLLLSPRLPTLGVLANLVAGPIGELCALPICLAHALLWWSPPAEQGAAQVGSGALLAVRGIAHFTADAADGLAMPTPTPLQLAVGAAVLTAAWASRRLGYFALIGVLALGVLELGARRAARPTGLLRVTSLDVGQGDATLVDLPDGAAMLVDGGGFVGSPVDPGERVVLPVLRARRRSRIDVMVLSHPHPDHFIGLYAVMEAVDVGELWDTGQGERDGAGPQYAALLRLARERGVPVRRPVDLCGAEHSIGGARIEVLAPCPGPDVDFSANDNSFVIRIRHGRRAVLLAGDAERDAEARLVAAQVDLHADLLKVGHHGSRTSSTPAFVEAVSPSLAVVSCGVRNRFGHPHPEALSALTRAGVPVARLDRGGQLTWETDGERIGIRRPRMH